MRPTREEVTKKIKEGIHLGYGENSWFLKLLLSILPYSDCGVTIKSLCIELFGEYDQRLNHILHVKMYDMNERFGITLHKRRIQVTCLGKNPYSYWIPRALHSKVDTLVSKLIDEEFEETRIVG